MVKVLIFFGLSLVSVVSFISLLFRIIFVAARHFKAGANRFNPSRLRTNIIILSVSIILCILFVVFTQITAHTPFVKSKDNSNSIYELRKIELNGRKEWISIRGTDKDNPILLFLAGGPGGSQMAAVRHTLSKLEKHFVVVNWDQPGSAKSYNAGKNISVENYIDDGYELTKYLCDEFNQEKIYLVGESWGSALGIFLADKAPELYHCVIGTGQMVAFLETELIDYEFAMEIAENKNDTGKLQKLKENGPPPYYGKNVTWKSAEYLQYLSDYMMRNPKIHNSGYNTLRDLFSEEYGIIDKINYFRGIVTTFNHVYPQLYETDLRINYAKLGVPIYFFIGRHDINAPTSLVEDYFETLTAPHKELVWFENSGHSPWINETDKFIDELLRVTLGGR
ncbi:MAG: alpha/beta hydrolase [Clostridiales bacterium]|jgi:pimeloyl-ACP methyl ester carboxylesterase|nr:alpha/beta hydrolase [Clostridiales bacterium]